MADVPHSPPDDSTDDAPDAAPLAEPNPAPETAPPTPEEEIARLTDKIKRVEAEFVNETRRIRRQAEQDRKFAIEQVVVDLLPVIDALAGARDGVGEGEASAPIRKGLDLVEQQFAAILQRYGVSPIEAHGMPFDPARHQAIMMIEREDVAPQSVCDVLRVGYELNGRVVRPAEVLVAKAPAPKAAEDDASRAGPEA
ncbi:MAG: nucleotide exchange factor GrpE [Planctomycetota bacterium]|nr:nucleotide exchange factor GrpE [Planctomycetota bacterium]